MEILERLLEHDRWATRQLMERCRSLTNAQLDQQFDIGHRTLRETLDHTVMVIDFWTRLMQGKTVTWEHHVNRSIPEIIERHEQFDTTFATFARQMNAEKRLEETFIDHFEAPMTFGGAILHVILHNDEHRTEVVHILNRLDVGNVPEVDHGLWDFVRRGLFEPDIPVDDTPKG